MDIVIPPELEDLILCSCCHLPFNDTDATPKLFSCRHYFCLKCVNSVLQKNGELYCVHCWKRTEISGATPTTTLSPTSPTTAAINNASSSSACLAGDDAHILSSPSNPKPENLPTYNAILYLAANFNKLNLNHLSTSTNKPKPPDIQQQQLLHHQLHNNNNIIKSNSNGNNINSNANNCNNNNHGSTNPITSTTNNNTNNANNDTKVNTNTSSAFPPLHTAAAAATSSSVMISPTSPSKSTNALCNSATVTSSQSSLLAQQLLASALSASLCSSASAPSSSAAGGTGGIGNGSLLPNQHHHLRTSDGGGSIKKGENCMTHAMPNTLWCLKCHTLICRACAGSDEHRNHSVKTQAKEAIRTEIATELAGMQKSLIEVQHLVLKQRDFLLKILESCTALKAHVEAELMNHGATQEMAEMRDNFCHAKLCLNMIEQAAAAAASANANGSIPSSSNCSTGSSVVVSPNPPAMSTPLEMYKLYAQLSAEKQRLHYKYQEMFLQCKYDDLLRSYGLVMDFETIGRALQTLHASAADPQNVAASSLSMASILHHHHHSQHNTSNAILPLTNYCITQLYSRQHATAADMMAINKFQQHHHQSQTQPLGNLILSPTGANHLSPGQRSSAHNLLMSGGSSSTLTSSTGSLFGTIGHPAHSSHNHSQHLSSLQQQTDNHHHQQHILTSSTSLSNLATTGGGSPSGAVNIPQLSSSYGGSKSPFMDLTVGSPSSLSSAASILASKSCTVSMLSGHKQPHPLHHFAQSQHQQPQHHHQLFNSNNNHNHFNDNPLLSGQFQGGGHHSITSNASVLNSLRSNGSGGGCGAGGISFEMNGITVPISMMSSHLPPPPPPTQQQQPQHHHQQHHLHALHSGNSQTTGNASTPSTSSSNSSVSNSIICNPTLHVYPIYYFNVEINGQPCGRILIEVRNDVAPRMAKNFGALATGELGFGYKGCQIFQCWENESIITGDFELNNGRGGRSVFEEGFFMPDDTKILAIRGSVGMRRSQKRHDNMGLVGSQFRIILREMRGFTGIFAFVIEGLELVEKISQTGDSAGKPQSNVIIVSCGKLQ